MSDTREQSKWTVTSPEGKTWQDEKLSRAALRAMFETNDPKEMLENILTANLEHLPDVEDGQCAHCGNIEQAALVSRAALTSDVAQAPFQSRVQPWMLECFGAEIAADKIERNHRFFEEATEAVQANGMTRSEAHQLVDYTFDRPVGELHQEIGGVMVTLAALCLASGQDMHAAGETELARIWTKVEAIRAKQAAKPKHSPLPVAPTPETTDAARDVLAERQRQVSVEGWTHQHDDGYTCRDLAHAAGSYAISGRNANLYPTGTPPKTWPWAPSWWRNAGERSCLVKAGALILAEIERLDRLAATAQSDAEGKS